MYSAAKLIREIGRGKEGAKNLDRDLARELFTAMLEEQVSDLELGAILIAFRIKGESIDELAGFLDACDAHLLKFQAAEYANAPVVIPSYNGARKKANLTPMLAMALARRGIPVLVHGLRQDPGRVCSADVFSALKLPFCSSQAEVEQQWQNGLPAFVPIDVLSPALYRLLIKRQILGLRNSAHTLVKLLQVFSEPALRLCSYTHPEYATTLQTYFQRYPQKRLGASLLLRATEGEAVSNAERAQEMNLWFDGKGQRIIEKQSLIAGAVADLPSAIDAETTARWITNALDSDAIPPNLRAQIEACYDLSRDLKLGVL